MNLESAFNLSTLLSLLGAFVTGICAALWRFIHVLTRIAVTEQKVQSIENNLKDLKTDLSRIEGKIDKVSLRKFTDDSQ